MKENEYVSPLINNLKIYLIKIESNDYKKVMFREKTKDLYIEDDTFQKVREFPSIILNI